MKKFLVILVVLALTVVSSVAFAGEITLGGSVEFRSRDFNNLDSNDKAIDPNETTKDTQTRVRFELNAKASDDLKGKIAFERDWATWGAAGANGYETSAAMPSAPSIREAWIDFKLPGTPVNVKAGHQFLQLGQGWFFRSMKFGSDAWVVYTDNGPNHFGVLDVKVSEGTTAIADDIDAYVILDNYKMSDALTVGANFTSLNDRRGAILGDEMNLQNLGLNLTGKFGPLNLKAELDLQMGKVKATGAADRKFKGNQIVVQASMPMDKLTVNATVARGTGDKVTATANDDIDGFVTLLDQDPHYTFLYEYKINQDPNGVGSNVISTTPDNHVHTGFYNTTALNVGATFKVSKSLSVGADLWLLQATEDVPNVATGTGTTSDLGTELDVKVNWQIYDNLSWNWTLGYLKSGDGLGKDAATGAQGVLGYKF